MNNNKTAQLITSAIKNENEEVLKCWSHSHGLKITTNESNNGQPIILLIIENH